MNVPHIAYCQLVIWDICLSIFHYVLQGVEIEYELYDPTIQKVEVLRLEKRLDSELMYLRDALAEYSTFDPNMEVEILPEGYIEWLFLDIFNFTLYFLFIGSPVPVNPIKVKLKPKPWLERWERQDLQGVQDLGLPEIFYKKAKEVAKPWEKYDLMKEYM